MPKFCGNCGAPLAEGIKFCGSCGAPVSATGGPTQAAQQPSAGAAAGGLEENIAALLSYVLGALTGIIFLVLEPYNRNRFVRFHAFQSIFLTVAAVIVSVGIGILQAIIGLAMPLVGFALVGMLGMLVGLAFFLLWLLMLYKAYQHEEYKLPVIGDLAQKQARS